MSGQLSAEKLIGNEGRDIGQDHPGSGLGQGQYLYITTVHGDPRLDNRVHLLHAVQEHDHSAVHPSGRHHATVTDFLPHSETDALHAAGEANTYSNTVFPC